MTFVSIFTFYFREQRAKRACLHAHLARVCPVLSGTAARIEYPVVLQRCKLDAPLLCSAASLMSRCSAALQT